MASPCPRCGPEGDVRVTAPGSAYCALCNGSFVSVAQVLPALATAGIGPAILREIIARDGRKVRPCPCCGAMMTTFPARREQIHTCTGCAAMWLDQGSLERLGGPELARAATPMPTRAPTPMPVNLGGPQGNVNDTPGAQDKVDGSVITSPTSLELERDVRPRGSVSERSILDVDRDARRAARADRAPAHQQVDAPILGIPVPVPGEENPFKASVRTFSERGGSGLAGRMLMFGLVVVAGAALYFIVTTAFMKGDPTPVGGGYEVLFWKQPVKKTDGHAGPWSGKRYSSPWGTNTLEVLYLPGAGAEMNKNGTPESILGGLYGNSFRIVGPPVDWAGPLWEYDAEFVIEKPGSAKNVGGRVRLYYTDKDAWVVSAYSDSNVFPGSGKAASFIDSLKKGAGGGADHARAAGGLAPDTD